MKKKLMVLALAALLLCGCLTVGVLAAEDVIVLDEKNGYELDLEIILYGDATKDGKVDIKDINQLNRYMNGLSSIFNSLSGDEQSYRMQVADVTRDDAVNIKDINQINRYMNGLPSVFDTFE